MLNANGHVHHGEKGIDNNITENDHRKELDGRHCYQKVITVEILPKVLSVPLYVKRTIRVQIPRIGGVIFGAKANFVRRFILFHALKIMDFTESQQVQTKQR